MTQERLFKETEIWKPVVGYETNYRVSNMGEIYSFHHNKYMKQFYRKGYLSVRLSKDGKTRNLMIHRLVAIAFLGDKSPLVVDHIDECKLNNSLHNLQWITAKQNTQKHFLLRDIHPNQLKLF